MNPSLLVPGSSFLTTRSAVYELNRKQRLLPTGEGATQRKEESREVGRQGHGQMTKTMIVANSDCALTKRLNLSLLSYSTRHG